MEKKVEQHFNTLLTRYPDLEPLREELTAAYDLLRVCFAQGGKLLVAGNGGSCADAEHIVGELMKGFCLPRRLDAGACKALNDVDAQLGDKLAAQLQQGLPAVSLSSHWALNTAVLNDTGSDVLYAQQVNVLGQAGDVFLGITTSGNAKNIQYAAVTAKAKGMKVLGLTGKTGGKLKELADVALVMPCHETYQIQELHLPVYHCLCLMLEEHFFG